jgi:hypothetical protein
MRLPIKYGVNELAVKYIIETKAQALCFCTWLIIRHRISCSSGASLRVVLEKERRIAAQLQ